MALKTFCRRVGFVSKVYQSLSMLLLPSLLMGLAGCSGTSHQDYAEQVSNLGGTMHVHVELSVSYLNHSL